MLPRWKDETVCILASGPSLTAEDAQTILSHKRQTRVIVVNETWRMFPWADALYAADSWWWQQRAPSESEFLGERWGSGRGWSVAGGWNGVKPPKELQLIKTVDARGVSTDPTFVYEGSNSAFQALGLAVLWGCKRIVFLGLDLSPGPVGEAHWHPDYLPPFTNQMTPEKAAYFGESFAFAAPILFKMGLEIINCSRRTSLTCFPRKSLSYALS